MFWHARHLARFGTVTAALLLFQRGARAQECARGSVTTVPAQPRQGAFFLIHVEGPLLAPTGTADAVPLHFVRDASRARYTALAGGPLEARAVSITVRCAPNDSLVRPVLLLPGQYRVERLSVAPEFSTEPDSALRQRVEREGAAARAVGLAAHQTPALWSAPLQPPRRARLTSRYGRTRAFNGRVTSRHMGLDYAGNIGASVRVVARGVVRLVEHFFYGGNAIYVDHGAGLSTAYLHLSAALVKVGDTVHVGQHIGRVGATGRVTGPHLHLITRYGTESLDPESLFRLLGGARPTSRRPQ